MYACPCCTREGDGHVLPEEFDTEDHIHLAMMHLRHAATGDVSPPEYEAPIYGAAHVLAESLYPRGWPQYPRWLLHHERERVDV